STNFNRRSLEHDEEVMLAVLDEDFTARLDADFDADRELSEPIDPRRWRHRPLPARLAEAAVTPIRRFLRAGGDECPRPGESSTCHQFFRSVGETVPQLLRVQNFNVSSDGIGAGEDQGLERPFGHVDPGRLFAW